LSARTSGRIMDAKIAATANERHRRNLQTVREHMYREKLLDPDGVVGTLSRRRIPSDCLLADGRRLEAARRGVLHERIGKSGYTAEARAQRNTRRLVCPGEAFQGDLGYRPGYHSRHRLSGRPAQPGSRDTRSLLNWAVSGERLLPCSGVAAGAVPIWSGRVCDSATSAERWPPAADPLRK
jgi:hypothetical protein